MSFNDYFSHRAKEYSRFRPDYPPGLYAHIYSRVSSFDAAWDAGTGNGQVAGALSRAFKRVFANDASGKQIENAVQYPNIEYLVSPSESVPIPSSCIDLITVAQALHWFRHDLFYKEVLRVAREHAVIAAWAYGLLSVSPEVDPVLVQFNREVVGPCWPPEREYVERDYETIPFPFERFSAPRFIIEKRMDFASLLGYVSTWSAVKRFSENFRKDPVDTLANELSRVWGPDEEKTVRWPLSLLVGRVSSLTLAP